MNKKLFFIFIFTLFLTISYDFFKAQTALANKWSTVFEGTADIAQEIGKNGLEAIIFSE